MTNAYTMWNKPPRLFPIPHREAPYLLNQHKQALYPTTPVHGQQLPQVCFCVWEIPTYLPGKGNWALRGPDSAPRPTVYLRKYFVPDWFVYRGMNL